MHSQTGLFGLSLPFVAWARQHLQAVDCCLGGAAQASNQATSSHMLAAKSNAQHMLAQFAALLFVQHPHGQLVTAQ